MKCLPPVIEAYQESRIVRILVEEWGVLVVGVRGSLLPDVGVEDLHVVHDLIRAVGPGSVPLLLAPWIPQPEKLLMLGDHVVVLVGDLDIDAEHINDSVNDNNSSC